MFKGTSLFIIGAGASHDAGLPIGSTLKDEIRGLLTFETDNGPPKGDSAIVSALNAFPVPRLDALRPYAFFGAGAQIAEAMPLAKSIDHYLHSHRGNEFIETCGKLAIARAILRAEANDSTSKLYVDPNNSFARLKLAGLKDSWYIPFGELLCSCTVDELPERLDRIQFIVFNYDRCIEQFLYWAFRIYFNLEKDAAAKLVNRMKIWHPYGKVGKLPWQEGPGVSVPFGAKRYDLAEVAKGIRTFTESNDGEGSDIDNLRAAVDAANTTIFLGCAYHELNLKLIQPPWHGTRLEMGRRKVFYGTTKGLSEPNREIAVRRINDLTHHKPTKAPIMPANLDCVTLFRDYYYQLDQ